VSWRGWDISQDDYDAVVADKDSLQAELDASQAEVTRLQALTAEQLQQLESLEHELEQANSAHPEYASGTYVANAGEIAGKQAADWSNAETVRVDLGEFYFNQTDLTFEASKPYKVELVNVGEVKHEFTSEDFFGSVA
jgi:hypothetical protein